MIRNLSMIVVLLIMAFVGLVWCGLIAAAVVWAVVTALRAMGVMP